jgi:hypothetical protein
MSHKHGITYCWRKLHRHTTHQRPTHQSRISMLMTLSCCLPQIDNTNTRRRGKSTQPIFFPSGMDHIMLQLPILKLQHTLLTYQPIPDLPRLQTQGTHGKQRYSFPLMRIHTTRTNTDFQRAKKNISWTK